MSPPASPDTLDHLAGTLTIEQVASLEDDPLRNYLITTSYHRLDAQMRRWIGPNLTRVGFGAWASALAGRTIRGEMPLFRWMPRPLGMRARRAVARGNQLVYADIAPVFRDFLAMLDRASPRERALFAHGGARDRAELHALVQETLRLDPRSLAEGGQALLCAAFEQYLIAAHEEDPDARAERVFVANAAIGVHEQSYLDPMIEEALSAPLLNGVARATLAPLFRLADVTRPARARVVPLLERGAARARLARWPAVADAWELSREARTFLRHVRAHRFTHAFATRFVLALPVGDDVLGVGRDVSAGADGSIFPEHLRVFDTTDARFRALLDEVLSWDRTPDSLVGSAASDWSDLADRMNFILDLFRSRQQDPALFANPLRRGAR